MVRFEFDEDIPGNGKGYWKISPFNNIYMINVFDLTPCSVSGKRLYM